VYFEKYVKGKQGQTLWIRNLQLSIYGVPLSMAYAYLRDGRCVSAIWISGSLRTHRSMRSQEQPAVACIHPMHEGWPVRMALSCSEVLS
jgi:hypothetical protein